MKILEHNETSACTKTLKIEVLRNEVEQELDGVYKEFINNAAIPGFRRGKVPRKIAEMKFGKELYGEASSKAMESAFKRALEEMNLKLASQPVLKEVEDEDKDNKNKPLVFEAKFEYLPTPETVKYGDIRVEEGSDEVSEKEVADVLNRLREQNAAFRGIDGREASDGDFVTISSEATVDGEPFREATHDRITVELGSGRYIAGFEDEIRGMAPGGEKTFSLPIPDDHPIESHRGKTGEFKVKVLEIQEKQLPDLDDEWAKDMGPYESLDEFKQRIREDLAKNREQSKLREMRDSVRSQLLEKNPMDVPGSMVRRRYEYLRRMAEANLRQQGLSLAQMARENEGLLARYEEQAANEVRLSILLKQIAELESMELTDEEFDHYIQQMAGSMGGTPEWLRRRIEDNDVVDYYREEALEEKVLNWLIRRSIPSGGGETAAAEGEAEEAKRDEAE